MAGFEERWSRRRFLKAIGLGAAALAAPAALFGGDGGGKGGKGRRPNFVFLLVDDLGYSDLASFGNTFHETPNVDRLGREGMTFTSAYAACAVCSPTRASIQTGKYPVRLGITDWIPGERHKDRPLVTKPTRTEMPLGEKTIAEALEEHGYRTAFVGKWHLGGKKFYPQHQGYEINIAGNDKGQPIHGYFSPYDLDQLKNGPKWEYLTDRLTEEALAILDRFGKRRDKPLLLFMSYYTVHMPIQSKPDLKRRFQEIKKEHPDPHWKNAAYAGMVASMDESVGRILKKIEELGVEKDTIVFFMSDNGGVDYAHVTSNYPLRAGKGRYHEGGIREPMIVRWPGVTRPGSRCDVPVISMDFYPTMLEMAGLPLDPEQHEDGLSLAPLIKGTGSIERDALFWHYPHYHGSGATPCSAIRMGDYKLIRYYEDGRKELYDVKRDIKERKDLAQAMPEKVAALEARLDAWLKETGAYIPVPRKP